MTGLSTGICLGTVLLLTCLNQQASAGIINITFTEDGGGSGVISATVSGNLTFSQGGTDSTGQYSNFIAPANGTFGFGSSSTLLQTWRTNDSALSIVSANSTSNAIFAGFGTGGYVENVIDNYSGTKLFTYANSIAIERSYTSDAAISGSGTISGDFLTRGISAGTATTVFQLNGTENTLNVIAVAASSPSSVPEPGSFSLAVLGLCCLGYGVRRKRKKAA